MKCIHLLSNNRLTTGNGKSDLYLDWYLRAEKEIAFNWST